MKFLYKQFAVSSAPIPFKLMKQLIFLPRNHIDILVASHFGVKTRANFKQGGNTPMRHNAPRCWARYAREDFKQSRFAGAVLTNNTKHFALLYFKIDIPQRPYKITRGLSCTVIDLPYFQVWIVFAPDIHGPPAV